MPAKESWLILAKALLGLRKNNEALATLVNGLEYAKDQEEAEDAIDLIIRLAPNTKATFQSLQKKSLPYGRDYILWQLAKLSENTEQQLDLQKNLLSQFPQSNWAPETAWTLMRHALLSGHNTDFLLQADAYLKKYPNRKSAAKVMFWKGKILQRENQPQAAVEVLDQLVKRYPANYFSFRAQQLLAGKPFPTRVSATTAIPITQDADVTNMGSFLPLDGTVQNAMESLLQAKTPATTENLLEILADIEGKKPHPYMLATIRSASGDHYSAIKLIDGYVADAVKNGQGANAMTSMPAFIKKIWYPLPYIDSINKWSKQRDLSPYFTASIIRQESAYNPLAISRSKALGLMQLLPSTATEVAKTERLLGFSIQSLFLPDTNIRLGTRYLQYLQQRFSSATIFMTGAYNGGPNAMAKWITQASATAPNADLDWFIEQIPYDQTREYIQQVYGHLFNYQSIYQ